MPSDIEKLINKKNALVLELLDIRNQISAIETWLAESTVNQILQVQEESHETSQFYFQLRDLETAAQTTQSQIEEIEIQIIKIKEK